MCLYRHLEKDKFDFEGALKLFEANADILSENEKSISFEKYVVMCANENLFSEKS